MFLGEHRYTLDDKGRVTLPSAFREGLNAGCVVTRGRDGNLWLFPLSTWNEKVIAGFAGMSTVDPSVRNARRYFLASASEEQPDAQGRIRIPQTLRDEADLQKEVVFTGDVDRVEIWSAEVWERTRPVAGAVAATDMPI